MVRNLVTAMLLATTPIVTDTPNNAVITQEITKSETINNIASGEFAEYTYDQNNDLETAYLYNVKEGNKTITIGTATFEYKQIAINRWSTQYNPHTYVYQFYKVARNTTTQESLLLQGIGNFSNNVLAPYAYDVTVYSISQNSLQYINTFFGTNEYTLQMLKNATDINNFLSLNANVEIDTTDIGNGYTLDTKQVSLQPYFIVYMDIDYDNLEMATLDNIRSTTYNYLTNYTVTYEYSITVADNTYEVVDIPGLLFEILGMPFAWLSTAFNLTIFPGTPYAINISHLFFALIGSLILIIVLKKILK